jgi:hypothetical protein
VKFKKLKKVKFVYTYDKLFLFTEISSNAQSAVFGHQQNLEQQQQQQSLPHYFPIHQNRNHPQQQQYFPQQCTIFKNDDNTMIINDFSYASSSSPATAIQHAIFCYAATATIFPMCRNWNGPNGASSNATTGASKLHHPRTTATTTDCFALSTIAAGIFNKLLKQQAFSQFRITKFGLYYICTYKLFNG